MCICLVLASTRWSWLIELFLAAVLGNGRPHEITRQTKGKMQAKDNLTVFSEFNY